MSHSAAELLNRARQAHQEERFTDAKRDLLAAVKICRESGPGKALAVALRQMGETERRLGNPAGALRSYEEAVALMREDTEPLVLAHTMRHLGDVHQEQGGPEQARPCYEEALAIYRSNEQSHPLNLANAIRAFAAHLYDADELQRSAPLWEEARNTYRSLGIHAGVAECSVRLARIARHQSDDQVADKQLAEARTAAEKSGDDEWLASVAKAACQYEYSEAQFLPFAKKKVEKTSSR
ncbi:MAG: tetratricopeptide repeat protein [Bryobacterales bacterium]|nr:tetratricopeptide repeat protein [Bryobacterales bacterium]